MFFAVKKMKNFEYFPKYSILLICNQDFGPDSWTKSSLVKDHWIELGLSNGVF
jgi:carbohydrate-binding DOMON domain-containing protein